MIRSAWFDQTLYEYALSHLGTPYRWGGDDPMQGYDCSGFVQELMRSVGLLDQRQDLTAQGIFYHFEKSTNGSYQVGCQFGSLVFYGSSVNRITHIAFGLDAYRVIEAGGGNSSTKDVEDAARQNAFVRIRPFDHRKYRVSIIKPFYHTIGEL